MRGILVLCFSAVAVAAPQYNYQLGQTNSGHQSGYEQGIQQNLPALFPQQVPAQSQFFSPQQSTVGASIAQQQHLFPQSAPQSIQQSISAAPTSFGASHQSVMSSQPPKPEVRVSKRFFIHAAPEEEDEETKEKVLTVGTPSKNYNVVFIRAPSKSNKKTSIKITPAVNEDKTVIYVLSKKTDASEIDAQIQELPTTTTKPEVYFIKYKTPEEAAHAQEKIQAEYDNLGGSTQVLNEGISQVSSVIGILEEKAKKQQQQQELQLNGQESNSLSNTNNNIQLQDTLPSGPGQTISNSIINTQNGYLPPNYYY